MLLIHEHIEQQVLKSPDAIALSYLNKTLTYSELSHKSNQLAHLLIKNGVTSEDIIAICCKSDFDYIISVLAILKSGAAFLPIDMSYPADRITYMLQDAKPKLMITQSDLSNQLPASSEQLIIIDCIEAELAQQSITFPDTKVTENNLAYIIYTSGSTGNPKGVMIEHKGIMNMATNAANNWPVNANSKVLQFGSISFDTSIQEWTATLISGAQLCLLSTNERPPNKRLVDVINDQQINIICVTPALLRMMPEIELPSLQTIVAGGEALSQKICNRFANKYRLINEYGPTEITVYATSWIAKANAPVMIGKPIKNTQIILADNQLNPIAEGEKGEILINGIGLARGYLNLNQQTAQRFITLNGERYYRTGDIGIQHSNGNIEYVGRNDDQIKIHGHRIEPKEIITTLEQCQFIKQAIIRIIGSGYDKRLALYYVPQALKKSNEQQVQRYIEQHLPKYMWPRFIIPIEKAPLTANDKIDYSSLPSHFSGSPIDVTPSTKVAIKLASIWKSLLHIDHISIYDDFFTLGGSSLSLTHMLYAVESEFQIKIDSKLFMANPIIKHLENLVKRNYDINTFDQGELIKQDIAKFNDTISTFNSSSQSQSQIKQKILLTGATGFLGAFLLSELINREMEVYCLIRAANAAEAQEKLENNLKRYQLYHANTQDNIHIVLGDLEKTQCGINDLKYAELIESIDVVFHCGAYVNHVLAYQQLRAANTLSTFGLIKFCMLSKPKQLHFISTVSAITAIDYQGFGLETVDQTIPKHFHNGYAASKYAAERLVVHAMQCGLNATIYRPGNITGDSNTGISAPETNHILLLLQASSTLHTAPNLEDVYIEMLPVDILAHAIITLATNPISQHKIYNMNNTVYDTWKTYIKRLVKHGYSIDFQATQRWMQIALQTFDDDAKIRPLLQNYLEHIDIDETQRYLSDKTQADLLELGITYPTDYDTLFDLYISHLIKTKFLPSSNQ